MAAFDSGAFSDAFDIDGSTPTPPEGSPVRVFFTAERLVSVTFTDEELE